MTGGFSGFLMYVVFMGAGFIPRVLGVLGLAATVSQMTGVFTGVLGHEVHLGFLAPLFVVHLLLSLWLMSFGFQERATAGEQKSARGGL